MFQSLVPTLMGVIHLPTTGMSHTVEANILVYLTHSWVGSPKRKPCARRRHFLVQLGNGFQIN